MDPPFRRLPESTPLGTLRLSVLRAAHPCGRVCLRPLSKDRSANHRMTSKPVLLTVDDDAAVLQALTLDLRRQYAQRFRVVRADSGQQALEILRELRVAEERVA